MGYAEVAVDLTGDLPDKLFHYRIPSSLKEEAVPGRRVVVSFGSRRIKGYIFRLLQKSDVPVVKDILDVLDDHALLNQEFIELAFWLSQRYYCRLIEGIRCLVPPGLDRIKGRKIIFVRSIITIDQVLIKEVASRAPKQAKILEYFANSSQLIVLAELLKITGTTASQVHALVGKGYLELVKAREKPDWEKSETFINIPPVLTAEQLNVLGEINDALLLKKQRTILLHGVTGSGKTEVYLQAVETSLKIGLGALILVPEIALTPQMVSIFSQRFGKRLAVLHSRLSQGERYRQWWRVKAGDVSVVLGARSAIFAPLSQLGILILDEEHENSYKQDEAPRYHTRDVALWRARFHQAVVLLGSATPSLESYTAARRGDYNLLRLSRRINDKSLPSVKVVDMRKELKSGNKTIFSRSLYRELKESLKRGEQAILFLNRRGFASFILCRECGYVLKCSHCSVSLTYHADLDSLLCHYCAYRQSLPDTCPDCRSRYIRTFGIGTQKVAEIFKHYFPGVRSLRMDTDSTTKRNSHEQILTDFEQGKASVLIGTQMIAKGLDIPKVTLVGVISADTSLHLPDFRAGERTFQLIAQVAGRTGRGRQGGKVIVQTYHPEHYSIRAAKTHDYASFYEEEIKRRRSLDYPPFTELLRFLLFSDEEKPVREAADKLKRSLQGLVTDGEAELLGPGPAPIVKLKDTYRYQLLLKGKNLTEHEKHIREAVSVCKKSFRKIAVRLVLDFNPYKML